MPRATSIKLLWPSLRSTFWRLLPYLRKQKPLIALSVAMLFFAVAMRLLEPWPLKFLIDALLSPGRGTRVPVPEFVTDLSPAWIVGLVVSAVVLIGCLRAAAEYVTRSGFAVISNRVLAQVRTDVYRHLQRLPLGFFSRSRAGDLVARVMTDVGMLRDVTSTAALPLVASILVFVGMWSFMLLLHWKLALATLAIVPLFGVISVRISRRIHDNARKQRQREAALAATAAEAIHGIKSVQAMALEDRFAGDFDRSSRGSADADIRAGRLSARLERSVDVLIALATATVLGYGATLVLKHEMSTGDLIVFLAYLRKAFNPIQDYAKYTGRLAKAAAAGERVLDVLDEPLPDESERERLPAAPPFAGHVAFDRVTFAYGDRAPVLDGLSFEIRPGEIVAIVGESGAGKSTTADLLLRFHRPQSGRVTVDGQDLSGFDAASVRRQVGVVLQETVLFAGSVRDNIAAGDDAMDDETVAAAVASSRSRDFVDRLPDGIDTVLSERGTTLSQGQRQRIAIARAMARRTPILILDEPTVGLDEENRRAVIDALVRLARGRSTLLITHDLELAEAADRILLLENGRITESGTPAELASSGGRFAAMRESQPSSPEKYERRELYAVEG